MRPTFLNANFQILTMAQDMIRTPSSMAGIMGFYDTTGGGPALDPRGVVAFTIAFIVVIKLVTVFM